jgi:hypothetical protein
LTIILLIFCMLPGGARATAESIFEILASSKFDRNLNGKISRGFGPLDVSVEPLVVREIVPQGAAKKNIGDPRG